MKIRMRPVSGGDFDVDIDPEESIDTLRCIIVSTKPELGDDPDDVKLVYKGKLLSDGDQTIEAVGIKDNEFVALMSKKKPSQAAPAAPAAPTAAPSAPAPVPAPAAGGGLMGAPPESAVTELCSMGFPRDQVLRALQAAFNNADRATAYLLDGNIPPPPQDAAPPPAAPAAAPAAPAAGGAWHSVLGEQLQTKSGLQPTAQALGGAKVVLLYFSAHWCPPCRNFTPSLARAFEALGQGQRQLQVVFVSMDRDSNSFNEYYGSMPWHALPYGGPQGQMLGAMYGVRGIPAVVALNGSTGAALDTQARDAITRNGFNLQACMQGWGVTPAAPPVAEAPAAASSAPAAPVAPKVKEPDPAEIDTALVTTVLERLRDVEDDVLETFCATFLKVLNNTLQNPQETKFRSLKKTNAAIQSKLLGVADGAASELLKVAGFEDGDEAIGLTAAPDGRCVAVRNEVQRFAEEEKMKQLRRERDAKIAEEIEKDKGRQPERRFGGGEDGRHQIGRRGPARGGGG